MRSFILMRGQQIAFAKLKDARGGFCRGISEDLAGIFLKTLYDGRVMQYYAVENPKELASANRQLIKLLRASADRRWAKHPIGFRPETTHETVYWNRNLRFWFADVARPDHHWGPFGIVEPTGTTALHIAVEINTPRAANHRRAGLLLRGSDNRMYLAHTGRVGGGKPEISRKAFLLAHGIKSRDVIEYDDGKLAILISDLEAPALVRRVGQFVHEVAEFKANVTHAPKITLPPQEDRPFKPKFVGKVTYEAKSRVQAELLHDLVVSSLSQRLGGNCRQTRRRDLFLRDAGGKITALYEVKTDCTTTSLYTGTGQLLLNGLAEEKEPRLVLVVPGEPDEGTKRVLDRLRVKVLTYRWVDGKPVFPKQSALLEGAPARAAETIAGRQVMGLEDFTDEDIAALEETRAQGASKAFDDETKSS